MSNIPSEQQLVPVVSSTGKLLSTCRPVRARKLVKRGRALVKWEGDIFYIQMLDIADGVVTTTNQSLDESKLTAIDDKPKKIAVIGSRDFRDRRLMREVLSKLTPFTLVSGGARGADRLAEEFADRNKLDKLIFLPDWETHGNSAGYIRNVSIINNCDQVVAFWDGKSRGTRHSIDYATKLKKPVKVVTFSNHRDTTNLKEN